LVFTREFPLSRVVRWTSWGVVVTSTSLLACSGQDADKTSDELATQADDSSQSGESGEAANDAEQVSSPPAEHETPSAPQVAAWLRLQTDQSSGANCSFDMSITTWPESNP